MRIPHPRSPGRTTATDGFTLTELLVALALLLLLGGIAIPAMGTSISRARAGAAMMELHGLLGHSRQEAVLRQREVTLCGTRDGRSCYSTWSGQPTLVFVDANRNRHLDAGEILVALSQLTRSARIRWRASGGRNYLRYHASGGVLEWGTFTYCPADNDARQARQIIIANTGRPRAATDRDGDGIIEDRAGVPLRCVP